MPNYESAKADSPNTPSPVSASPAPPPYHHGQRDEYAPNLPEVVPADYPELHTSDLPEVRPSDYPELHNKDHDYPQMGYSSLPEVVNYGNGGYHHEAAYDHEHMRAEEGAKEVAGGVGADEAKPAKDAKPWWKRYWIPLLVGAIVVLGAAIGGGVGGSLAAANAKKSSEGAEPTPTSITSSPTSSASTTSTTSTTSSTVSTVPTPTGMVFLARLLTNGRLVDSVGFLLSDSETACESAVAYAAPGRVPCDQPFTLSDGLTYRWRGCGSLPTFMTWAPSIDAEELRLGTCGDVPAISQWTCNNGSIIEADWLCGNSGLAIVEPGP